MGSDNSDEENRDRVLAPDDLDITKQPEVEEIDDGRYVVSPDGPAEKPDRDLLENPDWLDTDDEEETAPQPSGTEPRQPQPDQPSHTDQPQRKQPTDPQRSSQPDQPTPPRQPQPDDGPTRQSTSGGGQPQPGSQSGGRNQQPQPGGQSGGRNQQPQSGGRSGGRNQQPQSGGRNQQPQPGDQSGGRNQQPQSSGQSGSRNQRSSQPDQSTTRDQQAGAGSQSGDRGRQPSSSGPSGGRSSHPSSNELAAHDQPPVDPPTAELTNENVSKFLAKELTQGSGDYGFDATLNVEGQVNRGRMTSDDIGETLETLLRWYARQTTDEVDPETVLGIILAGTDLAVEYPVQSAYAMVKQHDLTPDDSIGDLLAAVRNEGSFTVPPSKD